jgi:hypothetical protein
MPNAADILWFKQNFQNDIQQAIAGTPFTLDFMVATACQETGDVWPVLRKKSLSVDQVVALCNGDTLDRPRTFPTNKADLLSKPNGQAMFDIARQALLDLAQQIPAFRGAAGNPNKFCHGFGVFQYDLQFFKTYPDYFLQKDYEKFSGTLGKALTELKAAAKRIHLDKPSLTDMELCAVGIAYNTGGFNPAKGLKQGHFDGQRFYGEELFDFLQLSRTVSVAGPAALQAAPAGRALLPPPPAMTASGPIFQVHTNIGSLRVRSAPSGGPAAIANVAAQLPDGHLVRAVTGKPVKKFMQVETSLNGATIGGFVAANFLKPAPHAADIPVVQPQAAPPTSGIVAVFMPPAGITKRTQPADAHSLNEPNMPDRTGTTPADLCTELGAIIAYLAVDKPAFKRYQPRDGLTFCNIYAHDYCHLAGVYLPRVWWTPGAIEQLAQGQTVQPLINQTIDEQRANDLFRWLRDFGPRFGWQQTGTLTALQQGANQGAIGIIVARRKEDGRSGHIVAVVPETTDNKAKRDNTGNVIAPLQSQAGARNFQYGTGTANWWKGAEFAESAFWLHP